MCSGVFNWDFEYDNRKEFIQGIKDCMIAYNSLLPEFERLPIELVLVQALHESGSDGQVQGLPKKEKTSSASRQYTGKIILFPLPMQALRSDASQKDAIVL